MTPRSTTPGTRVFVRHTPPVPAATRWSLGLAGLAMAIIGWQLYLLFPAETWRRVGTQLLTSATPPGGRLILMQAVSGLALTAAVWWAHRRHLRDGRLTLDAGALRFESGIPLLRAWLNWSLRLDDLRDGRIRPRLLAPLLGTQALWLIRLGWGRTGLHSLRPAAWALQGDAGTAKDSPAEQPPHRPLGYLNWHHPDNIAWLQRHYEALPLVSALREHGVELPCLQRQRADAEGPDLLAHPRLKAVLIALPVLLVLGALMLHGSRFQHYVSPWPMSTWLACGTGLCALTLAWHWTLAPPPPADRAQRWGLWFAQWLTSVLMALLACWNLAHAPLAWGRAFAPAHRVDYVLDADQARLQPPPGSGAPGPIALDLRAGYWRAQLDGSVQPLDVRTGWAGWWTQYDTEFLLRRTPTR